MSLFIKLFNTTTEYNVYTADTANFILPNVSCAMDDLTTVHYNPNVPPETRLVAKYNVTNTSYPTKLFFASSGSGSGPGDEPPFSAMEIDGVEQSEVVNEYTFDTASEHTVKYTLIDPTSIGDYVFSDCSSLTSIDIPDSVTSIGENAFYNCTSLTSCTIGSGVTSIGEHAFHQCSGLRSIDIPNSVTSIGNAVFLGCSSLSSIDIPNSVTSIGTYAFYDCTSLTSCTIGSGVTSIGEHAFQNCSSLTSITSNATTAPTISYDTFLNVSTNGTLTVPIGSSGYDTWMWNTSYYLGYYNWTKVEQ